LALLVVVAVATNGAAVVAANASETGAADASFARANACKTWELLMPPSSCRLRHRSRQHLAASMDLWSQTARYSTSPSSISKTFCSYRQRIYTSRSQFDGMAGILEQGIRLTMQDLEREGLWSLNADAHVAL
jgi:hypothetical protein